MEISDNGLILRCRQCNKGLYYTPRFSLVIWREMKAAFLRRHRDCVTPREKSDEL